MDLASPWQRMPRTIVIAGVVIAVFASLIGAYAGLRSPWGAKHTQVATGVAMRANLENDLVMFDADDGEQFTFHADGMRWESDNIVGEGNPPCVRRSRVKADVEVAFIWVAGPQQGRFQQVVWVRCL